MDILERLKLRVTDPGAPEPDDNVLEACLDEAKAEIMSRRFPFGEWPDEIEPQYVTLQIRIAIEIYDRIGMEGEKDHTENGISRKFESSTVSSRLLEQITPYCGVVQ